MSLLVLLISLPLPHYRCLTTALLCVIALSAFAVWLHCERGSSLLGLAGAPASMDVASPPSEQVAREARQGEACLPAQCHASREPEVEATLALAAVPPYIAGQSEPFILPALTAANRLPCESELGIGRLQLPFALTRRVFDVSQGAGGEPVLLLELLMTCLLFLSDFLLSRTT